MNAQPGTRTLLIRDLVLAARIGVFDREKTAAQRVRIGVELEVLDRPVDDRRIGDVVRYDKLIAEIRAMLAEGHINLVETLAERVAAICLRPADARAARVRVEKLDIEPDAAAVGVEIRRFRT
ncbi:MAG: dihydroneopterin aldolase [Azospirillum sp.]|nr:dihydroneopterin aldolase [Azospirillum sp.]MCA3267012.1 dihydroneopterin aldolase [Azospirillum sp.]MCZ8125164.1 dihydroneopterin aldolase [Magnetospirillum sp.]